MNKMNSIPRKDFPSNNKFKITSSSSKCTSDIIRRNILTSFIQTSKELTLAGICILLGLGNETISNFCALPASLDGFTFLMLSDEGTDNPLATSYLLQRANTAIAASARFFVSIIFRFADLGSYGLQVGSDQ